MRAIKVLPFIRVVKYQEMNISTYIIGLKLILEDGRSFILVNIPYEVAEAIKVFNGYEEPPKRQSLFSLLVNHEDFKEALGRALKRVIIDELDYETSLYTATVEFEEEDITLRVKMIPSHAIFMALVAGKPIYVTENLVEEAEGELEDLGLDDDFEDEIGL